MSKPTGNGRSRSRRSRPSSVDPETAAHVASTPIQIGILGYEGVTALDLVGPMDALHTANEVAQELHHGSAHYQIVLLGLERAAFTAESGLRFEAHVLLDQAPPPHTLIVPGGAGLRHSAANARLTAWLRQHSQACRRVASVCTGIYGLAPSGLLDGRRVATHWRFAADVAQRFPRLRVDQDALYVRDGRYVTSAGITAGIDLALALIEEDLGPRIALAVARELVVYLKRPGGQAQFSEPLRMQVRSSDRFADLAAWIVRHLGSDLSVDALAARAGLSPRHFSRRFRAVFGNAPARYVEALRMNEARRMLGADGGGIKRVAAALGFASTDVFRRAFERRFGLSPGEYRERFKA